MQKKKLLQLSLGLVTGILIVGIAVSILNKKEAPAAAKEFPAALLQSHTSWQAPEDAGPRLLIFYNPECDHCQYEAKTLSTHPDFWKMEIAWLSGESSEANQAFRKEYAADAPASFQFLDDPEHQIGNALGVSIFPTIFIYGADGMLLHKYEGETKPAAILKWIP